jgi:hypothetical protein
MPLQDKVPLVHSNRYSADLACAHCDGVSSHEPWCKTQNASVLYAYQVVDDPAHMSRGDRLILHALGATWTAKRPHTRQSSSG